MVETQCVAELVGDTWGESVDVIGQLDESVTDFGTHGEIRHETAKILGREEIVAT